MNGLWHQYIPNMNPSLGHGKGGKCIQCKQLNGDTAWLCAQLQDSTAAGQHSKTPFLLDNSALLSFGLVCFTLLCFILPAQLWTNEISSMLQLQQGNVVFSLGWKLKLHFLSNREADLQKSP